MSEIKPWEGPWIDEQGRKCLGIWADEGGRLLILRAEPNGGITFHHASDGVGSDSSITIGSFRLARIAAFLDAEKREATTPMRDLRKAP